MTNNRLNDELKTWSSIFTAELRAHLQDLQESGTRGFAIELPSDFGNRDGVISRIAKTENSLNDLDDWEHVPNLATFGRSCEGLEKVYDTYEGQFDDEVYYNKFADQLYGCILDVMKTVVSSGDYSNISVWLLTLSDDQHPVLEQAAKSLNSPDRHVLAKNLIQ